MNLIRDVEMMASPNRNESGALATRRLGANEVSVIRQRQAAGGFNPDHSHNTEEVIMLLSGRLAVTVDGERQEMTAGNALIVPAGSVHSHVNLGEDSAELLLISPANRTFITTSGQEVMPPWAH